MPGVTIGRQADAPCAWPARRMCPSGRLVPAVVQLGQPLLPCSYQRHRKGLAALPIALGAYSCAIFLSSRLDGPIERGRASQSKAHGFRAARRVPQSHDRIRDRDKQPTPEVGCGVVEQDDLPFTNCKPSRAATGSHGQCACGSETTQRVRAC